MQFKIDIDGLDKRLYSEYCDFIFDKMNEDLEDLVDQYSKNYKVRESWILDSSLIDWSSEEKPDSIDLKEIVKKCLEMKSSKGYYFIKVDEDDIIPGSITKVSKLIRALEYGFDKYPELLVVRKLMKYYSEYYDDFYEEFMEEQFG